LPKPTNPISMGDPFSSRVTPMRAMAEPCPFGPFQLILNLGRRLIPRSTDGF